MNDLAAVIESAIVESAPPREPAAEVPEEVVRQHLDEVLASPMFDASARNRHFLQYTVEETLAGRGHRIKGYDIGVSVFGRSPDFDPQIDPVVRVEAGRLRRSLEHYYLTDGRSAAVEISIPKGRYKADFEWHAAVPLSAAARAEASAGLPDGRLRIFVLPLVPLAMGNQVIGSSGAITEEIVMEFGKRPEFEVSMLPFMPVGQIQVQPAVFNGSNARLVVKGSVRIVAGMLRVVVHIVDRADSRVLWSSSHTRDLTRERPSDPEADIGIEIVGALAGWLRKTVSP